MDQPDRGVLIRAVEPNSPAAKAGLTTDGLVMEFNKQDVRYWRSAIRATGPGDATRPNRRSEGPAR